jgi:activator of HSP90 ATPase
VLDRAAPFDSLVLNMAKVGEGDARWIVQEREDGTNVHGWHWQERDVLKWSTVRLSELLGGCKVLNGEDQIFITTTTIDSVTGEALINNRKKELIPSYELAVKGQWTGEIKDGSGTSVMSTSGTFQLPYISDENADEDPELTVSLTDEGSAQQRLKQAFVNKGKKVRSTSCMQIWETHLFCMAPVNHPFLAANCSAIYQFGRVK